MNPEDIEELLRAELTDCEVSVSGSGNHFDINVVGEVFEGLRAVRRQQLVYAVLTEHIASGAIHAVNIRTSTPGESASQA